MIRSVSPNPGPNAFILWAVPGRVFNASEVPDGFRLPDASLVQVDRASSASSMTISLGDVNGDGIDDVALQTAGVMDGLSPVVTILFGSSASDAWGYIIDLTVIAPPIGVTLNFGLGTSLSSNIGSGDVNGDGQGDILVGQSGNGLPGIVCVVYGQADAGAWPAAGLNLPQDIYADPALGFILRSSASPTLGAAVASGGDFNCDGHVDVIVADEGVDDGAGRVYIVFGRPGGFNASVDVSTLSPSEGLSFSPLDAANASNSEGRHVASATFVGDFNRDGCSDVLVRGDDLEVYMLMGSATAAVRGRYSDATAVIYRGDLQGDAGYVITPGQAELSFTTPPVDDAKHADFNGDGVSDVLLSLSNGTTFILFGGYIPVPSASASPSASSSPSISVSSSPGSSASPTVSSSWSNATASPASPPSAAGGWTWGIAEIAGVAAGGGFVLVLLIVAVACCCRVKSSNEGGLSASSTSLQSGSRLTRTGSRHMIAESDDAAGSLYSSYAALAEDAAT